MNYSLPYPYEPKNLTAEEEKRLFAIIKAQGPDAAAAKNTIVQKHLWLVVFYAKKIKPTTDMNFQDLVQDGSFGILKAIERFDHTRIERFSTFAHYHVMKALRKSQNSLIKTPYYWKSKRCISGVSDELKKSIDKFRTTISLDHKNNDDGKTILDSLASREKPSCGLEINDLLKFLDALSAIQRNVLELRFGLKNESKGKSLEEVSSIIGISRESVRRIQLESMEIIKMRMKKDCYYCGKLCSSLEDLGVHLVSDHLGSSNIEEIEKTQILQNKNELPEFINYLPGKKNPLKHQVEALSAINAILKRDSRATVVMACGTGKTLVGMWTSKIISSKRTLILCPSLSLLRQSILEWKANNAADSYLVICSDQTVGQVDTLTISESDIGSPVTTSEIEVREALKNKTGHLAVFCTYQSVPVLSCAFTKQDCFDIIIFDEAHKTCGEEGSLFSKALSDENVRAEKRIFMTATPRVTRNINHNNKTYSMDDIFIYGPHAYSLTMDEAIKRDIISDYKVIVPVVENDDIFNDLDASLTGFDSKSKLDVSQAMYYIALSKAIKKSKASRIITFHGSVSEAKAFTQSKLWDSEYLPEKFDRFHVNGAMKTSVRETILNSVRKSKRAVVSNARCLLEGIDVPTVDMVAFMSPRKSKIDITQAIGRALRKAPGKKHGFVMVPAILNKEGDVVLASNEYTDIIDVVRSLSSQDPLFEKELQKNAFRRGAGQPTDNTLGGRIEYIADAGQMKAMDKAMSAKILDRKQCSWDEMFGKLVAWKNKTGKIDTWSYSSDDKSNEYHNWELNVWARAQRVKKNSNQLEPRKITLLESIGFPWDIVDSRWLEMYSRLCKFKKEKGHLDVPEKHEEDKALYSFVRFQRMRKNLSADKRDKLDKIGFKWSQRDATWDNCYLEVKNFYEKNNHILIPIEFSVKICQWLSRQRTLFSQNKLDEYKIERLNNLGILWDTKEALWMTYYTQVISVGYQKANEINKFSMWIHKNKKAYANGTISHSKKTLLETASICVD